MHFEITVSNSHYPLVYKCSTAHEAFGCIEALSTGLLSQIEFDMDEIMGALVKMKNGELLRTDNHWYGIRVMEGEV